MKASDVINGGKQLPKIKDRQVRIKVLQYHLICQEEIQGFFNAVWRPTTIRPVPNRRQSQTAENLLISRGLYSEKETKTASRLIALPD